MWRCQNCGASVADGTICTACGQIFEDALYAIDRKLGRLRRTDGIAGRWIRRGAVVGFIAGSVPSLLLAGFLIIRHLIAPPYQETIGDVFAIILSVFILIAVIFLPLLFAAIFLVFGSVIKPICVAMFCSIERFEQEYGSSRK